MAKFKVKLPVFNRTVDIPIPILFWAIFTVCSLTGFLCYVDLKPKVDEHFFFSSDDPQFKEDRMISEVFPQMPQIILAAKGDLRSTFYMEKMEELSRALSGLPEVFSVQSLTRGPEDLQDALEGPLWRRVLIAEDGQASLVSVFLKDVPPELVVPKIEKIAEAVETPDLT